MRWIAVTALGCPSRRKTLSSVPRPCERDCHVDSTPLRWNQKGWGDANLRLIVCLGASLALAGCSQSDRIARMESQDDAACRAQSSQDYQACRAARMEYRRLAAQQQQRQAESLDAFGQSLQSAGAALSNISPPPPAAPPIPQTTRCQQMGAQTVCQTW